MIINKQLMLTSYFEVEKAAEGSEEKDLMIKGYANTTVKDRVGDVVLEEAWTKGGLTNYQKNPIMLAFHNHSKPIGMITQMTVTPKGLEVVGKVSKAAGDVYQLIKEGILKTFSVGFRVKEADYDKASDIFVIKDLELFEISVVSVPANQDSTFSVAKCFDSDEEFKKFKQSFVPPSEDETEKSAKSKKGTDEELDMTINKEDLDAVVKQAVENAQKEAIEAAAAVAAKAAIEVGSSGAERLIADVDKRVKEAIEANEATFMKSFEDLKGTLAEKNAEIEALTRSKMSFEEKRTEDLVTDAEKQACVLLAKVQNKRLEDTKLFKQVMEKAGNTTQHAHVYSTHWENITSTSMLNDIRKNLVLAPLFNSIQMPGVVLRLPTNPEAGYATWVHNTEYMTTASSGALATQALGEATLQAHKLATKELLGTEEEDDSIIPLLPIIRDAIIRRMAKAVDKALLRGAGSASDPLKGVAVYGTSANGLVTQTAQATTSFTTSHLAAMRRKLGYYGLDPSGIVYIVSQDSYFDLLQDTNFQTMDKVGVNAVLLKGQIGQVFGSPVLVSGEFEAKANDKVGAVALYAGNFIIGNYKGLLMESDYRVESSSRLLVASLRMGFLQKFTTGSSEGAAVLQWKT